jgi:hypothetical protein
LLHEVGRVERRSIAFTDKIPESAFFALQDVCALVVTRQESLVIWISTRDAFPATGQLVLLQDAALGDRDIRTEGGVCRHHIDGAERYGLVRRLHAWKVAHREL